MELYPPYPDSDSLYLTSYPPLCYPFIRMTAETIPEKLLKYKRGENPNSRKNLKSGYHGQGNGQNGYSLTSELKHMLQDKELRQKLVESTIRGAIKREVTPFKEVWDRVEGKVSGDQPPVQNDNRVLNIIVLDRHTAELISQMGERAKRLEVGVEAT